VKSHEVIRLVASLKLTFHSNQDIPDRIKIDDTCSFVLKNWGAFCPDVCVGVADGNIFELLIEYSDDNKKCEVIDLFCAAVCVVSGFNSLDPQTVLSNMNSPNYSSTFSKDEYYYNACIMVQKCFSNQHQMNAVCKFYVAHKAIELHPLDLHPKYDPLKKEYLLTELISISNVIICCYSVLEELGLNIVVKQNESSLTSDGTKWNPDVYNRLCNSLLENNLNPNMDVMWLSRNGILRPFKTPVINITSECEWSDGNMIKDFNIKLTDAILELSYMRSKLSSHNIGSRVLQLTIYDAENAFHLARMVLLEYFSKK